MMILLLAFLVFPILSFFSDNEILFMKQNQYVFEKSLDFITENDSDVIAAIEPLESVYMVAIDQKIPDWLSQYIWKCKQVIIRGGFNQHLQDFFKNIPSHSAFAASAIEELEIIEIIDDNRFNQSNQMLNLEFVNHGLAASMKRLRLKSFTSEMYQCDDKVVAAISDYIVGSETIDSVKFKFHGSGPGCSHYALSKVFGILKTPFLKRFDLNAHKFGNAGKSPIHYLKETLPKSPVTQIDICAWDYVLSEKDSKELGPLIYESQLESLSLAFENMFRVAPEFEMIRDSQLLQFSILIKPNGHLNNIGFLDRGADAEVRTKIQIFNDLREAYLHDDFQTVIHLAYHRDRSYSGKRIVGWVADAVADSKKHYLLEALQAVNVNISNIGLKDDELSLALKSYKSQKKTKIGNVIQSLNLAKNSLTPKCIKSLNLAMKRFKIQHIDLSDNRIKDAGLKQLSRSIPGSQLISLNLCHNGITDEGVIELARNLAYGNRLRSLKLSHNSIGNLGSQSLANALAKSPLEELELNGCTDIGDEGLSALAANLPLSQLIKLDLITKQLAFQTLEMLIASLENSQISQFKYQHCDANFKDKPYLNKIANVSARNSGKYKAFTEIRDAFNSGSFEKVVKLAEAQNDGSARFVGWTREIVQVSRQYAAIKKLKDSRWKKLVRERQNTFELNEMSPIFEEVIMN